MYCQKSTTLAGFFRWLRGKVTIRILGIATPVELIYGFGYAWTFALRMVIGLRTLNVLDSNKISNIAFYLLIDIGIVSKAADALSIFCFMYASQEQYRKQLCQEGSSRQ
jgi:hypothetical protein